MQHDVPNKVSRFWVEMLQSFGQALKRSHSFADKMRETLEKFIQICVDQRELYMLQDVALKCCERLARALAYRRSKVCVSV